MYKPKVKACDLMWKDCEYLNIGDRVKLSIHASKFKVLNSTIPQYRADGLNHNDIYVIGDVTPIMKVVGGNQQFLSLDGMDTTYPCWCFEKQN